MTEDTIKITQQIKYDIMQIEGLVRGIDKANFELLGSFGKEERVRTRESALSHFREKLSEHSEMLLEYSAKLAALDKVDLLH